MTQWRAWVAIVVVALCLGGVSVALLIASASTSRPAAARALKVVAAPTFRFIRGYMTAGDYANVRGEAGLSATNTALRGAILDDQDRYAKWARPAVRSSREGGNPWKGIYRTELDRDLTSASTVVVSALIPALELYPGGNDGQTWISATVEVRTGNRIPLKDLLTGAALPVIAKTWVKALGPQVPDCGRVCRNWIASMRPSYPATYGHYRAFALLPTGLAIGFPQFPAGSRMVAVIPYQAVRP